MAVATAAASRVTLRAVLVSLTKLLACVVAIGLIAVADTFVRALFGTLKGAISWIPWAGDVISAPVHKVEQKLVSYLGAVERGLANEIAACFSQLAHVFVELSADIAATAVALSALTWYVTKKLSTAAIDSKATRAYLKALQAERATKRALEAIDRIESGRAIPLTPSASIPIRVVTKPLERRIGRLERTTDIRLDRLEHAIARPGAIAVPRVGSPEFVGRAELSRALKRIRALERKWGLYALAGATFFMFRRFGLGWLRCANVGRVGRAICGLPPALVTALFTNAIPLLLLSDVCRMSAFIRRAAEVAEPALRRLVTEVGAATHCTTFPPAPALPLRTMRVAQSSRTIAL